MSAPAPCAKRRFERERGLAIDQYRSVMQPARRGDPQQRHVANSAIAP
jgi:hypothetical protein